MYLVHALLFLSTFVLLSYSQTCTVREGVDIDLPDLAAHNNRPEFECCGLCRANPRCKGYSWNNHEGGTCWLKEGAGPTKPVDGVKSGTLEAGGGGGKKVICYYTNWSRYREGGADYYPSDIDPSICTHIMYSFAILNPQSLVIQVADPQTDIIDRFYAQVTALKERGVKVMIAIGGWGDSEGDKYSRMVNSASARANFVNTAVEFIRTYNFDGLDLDWEYPVCWQGDCRGPASDKENFANLVAELRAAFTPYGFLLSSAVSASASISDRAYDVPKLSQNLDWIGLMTYDMHGGWDGVTGHNSPFRGPPPNSVEVVNYWVNKGASRDKIVLGVPLYGRSFTLTNPNNNGVGAPATNGRPGPITGEGGFLAYIEFCTGWTKQNNPNVGPYAYNGDQWASYDDTAIIGLKSEYIKTEGIAGAMVWAIDLDDYNGNFCGSGRYPLLGALYSALND